jgi:hypothetical protein
MLVDTNNSLQRIHLVNEVLPEAHFNLVSQSHLEDIGVTILISGRGWKWLKTCGGL